MSERCALPALRQAKYAQSYQITVCEDRLVLTGNLSIDVLSDLDCAELLDIARNKSVIDITNLERIDSAGAWFLVDLQQRASTAGNDVTLEGANDAQAQLIDVVRENMPWILKPQLEQQTNI
jgi:phospholipid/cholesterol/gamma-HCH transport system permease protein